LNARLLFLVIGVIVGGVIGWLTAPAPAVDMKVGNVSVQVGGNGSGGAVTATDNNGGGLNISVGNGGFLADRTQRTLVFALIGGVIGLAIGFAADRRKAV
jgi:hypothetical protein